MTESLVDDSVLRLLETELSNMLEAAPKTDQHGLLVNDALHQRDGSLAGHARTHRALRNDIGWR